MTLKRLVSPQEHAQQVAAAKQGIPPDLVERVAHLEAAYGVAINRMAQVETQLGMNLQGLMNLIDAVIDVVGPENVKAAAQARNKSHMAAVAEAGARAAQQAAAQTNANPGLVKP